MRINIMNKIYLASSMAPEYRDVIQSAAKILRDLKYEVYVPLEHAIPNAWDYPNNEWGLMVFTEDVSAIQDSDWVVLLNYGRNGTSPTGGSAWEAGFAYGIGKRVVVVDMIKNKSEHTSLMIENGRYATVDGLDEMKIFFENGGLEDPVKYRTKHEQS
jgi:nucleoside 2-deoxyribosyltransferase